MFQKRQNRPNLRTRVQKSEQPADIFYWLERPPIERILALEKFGKNTTIGNMVLNEDFKEFIKLLNDNEVKYLIVGGYAVALYGHPRYTKDLDFWVWLNETNAEKIIKTLQEFGFAALGLTPTDFLNPENVIQLGYPPNQIDLITELTGLEFEPCFANRKELEFEGLKINFIALTDLIENKRKTGRLKDLADAEELLKSKKKKT